MLARLLLLVGFVVVTVTFASLVTAKAVNTADAVNKRLEMATNP